MLGNTSNMIPNSVNEEERHSGSEDSLEDAMYYTKMKTIPKVTLNLHGKIELSEEAKAVLQNETFG